MGGNARRTRLENGEGEKGERDKRMGEEGMERWREGGRERLEVKVAGKEEEVGTDNLLILLLHCSFPRLPNDREETSAGDYYNQIHVCVSHCLTPLLDNPLINFSGCQFFYIVFCISMSIN